MTEVKEFGLEGSAGSSPLRMTLDDGRPLLDRFRQLAPAHAPVSIQRWSTQRLLLTAAAALGALLLTGLFVDSLRAGFG